MDLRFSNQPGRRERHLQRRQDNPLFGNPPPRASRGELDRARAADRQEAAAFERRFAELVKKTAGLPPNADSELILQLKSDLDQAYEEASGLPGDWQAQKQAITQLVGLIMQAVRRGAGNDAQAVDELEQEETARRLHYQLLEYPLVADLLHPETPIPPEDLAPTLLCCEAKELQAVLPLFEPEQLDELERQAAGRLDQLPADALPAAAEERLQQLREYLSGAPPEQVH